MPILFSTVSLQRVCNHNNNNNNHVYHSWQENRKLKIDLTEQWDK